MCRPEYSFEDFAETILTFADCNMNMRKTSKTCHVHYNSVQYALAKTHQLTGLNPKNFYDLIELVKMAREVLKKDEKEESIYKMQIVDV